MTYDVGLTLPAVYDDPTIEAIERAADAGVEGVEFFDWEGVDEAALREAADEHGIEVYGTLATGAGSVIMDPDMPAMADPDSHEQVVEDVERSIEAAADIGCATLIVTVGQDDQTLGDATQQAAIVAALRAVAPTAEAHDVTIAIEPLNRRVDHPGYFVATTDRAVAIVDAVESEHVKILFDVYHQQVTDGDVTRRLERHIEHVGHVHVADTPGRHEPGTGELDYEYLCERLAGLEYDGYVSGEFVPENDADAAVQEFVRIATEARERAGRSTDGE